MSDNWEYNHNYLPTILANAEERDKRIIKCKECEYISTLNFCSECKCFMPAKTWVKSRVCPIGKW